MFHDVIEAILRLMNGERTPAAAYHMIRGKRSGQTIQDVGYFHSASYFGILPKLERADFDEAVEEMARSGRIALQSGRAFVAPTSDRRALRFDGWRRRGSEQLFFRRLALAVQSLSHARSGRLRFLPAERDAAIQRFVKGWLQSISYREELAYERFCAALAALLTLDQLTAVHRAVLCARLSGDGEPGMTWPQIASRLGASEIDARLQAVEALHIALAAIERARPPAALSFLRPLAVGACAEDVLTSSARRTYELLQRGLTLEQIAAERGLKASTIEDHFVELTARDMLTALDRYVEPALAANIRALAGRRQTKKLSELQALMPQATYFQIRLALSKGEEADGTTAAAAPTFRL